MLGITNVSNAPSIVLTNTSVSSWTALPSTGTDSDMKTQGYTYYASIPCNGISADTIAEVTFSEANAKSGNYASTCRTYANEIRVYSKVNTAITIPSIIVHSIVETYYTLDNAPTSGSTKAVTSGGVFSMANASHTVTLTNLTGETVFGSSVVKIGRTVQGYILMNFSVARNNQSIFTLTCDSNIVPAGSWAFVAHTYDQVGDVKGLHRNYYFGNASSDGKSINLVIGSDMNYPLANWVFSFSYLTQA